MSLSYLAPGVKTKFSHNGFAKIWETRNTPLTFNQYFVTRSSSISMFGGSVFKTYIGTYKEIVTDNRSTDNKTGVCEDKPNTLIQIPLPQFVMSLISGDGLELF